MEINGITLKQEGHYWVLSYNGKYVGDLFRTYHPTIPYEVYYKELAGNNQYDVGEGREYIDSKRCYTHEEATAWVRKQIEERQPGDWVRESLVVEFFGPWR